MNLIIIYGLPGSGKKTVGIELEKITGYKLLDNHLVLDIVRKFIPKQSFLSTIIARDFRLNLIKGALESGCPGIILTVAGGSPGAQEYLIHCVDLVEKSGGSALLIKLSCERSELLRRHADPSRQGTKSHTEEELNEKNYFDGMPDHESIVIDNTNLSAIGAAQKIALLIP